MSSSENSTYLPGGLPIPVAEPDGLSAPYWEGLRHGQLLVQRCWRCDTWQFGPEWICHRCHAFDPSWTEVEPRGRIFSWERVWHPSHSALKEHGPYLAVLVEIPHAGGVRMVGNLLGDPMQAVTIGANVEGVFEHHPDSDPPYSLLQWRICKSIERTFDPNDADAPFQASACRRGKRQEFVAAVLRAIAEHG